MGGQPTKQHDQRRRQGHLIWAAFGEEEWAGAAEASVKHRLRLP